MIIDRATLGSNQRSFSWSYSKWRIPDIALLLIVMLINYPVYLQEPFQRQFYLNDLTISHPFAEVERVSDTMLVIYSLVVPIVTIICVWVLLADPRHKWFLLHISLLGLLLTWFTTCLFTNYIKNWFGRLRPDFLDRCQPKPGLPLNTLFTASEVCTSEDRAILLDGFRTTPSGHSSESFAGLGYLYLWLCGQLLTENIYVGIWRKWLAGLPLVGASLIALSRTEDYRHHFVDILVGSILGYAIAYFYYGRYFPDISSRNPFKPLMDDSDVTLANTEERERVLDEEVQPLQANRS